MLLFTSWAAYIAEHPTNPGFATFGDSLWWGIVTLTTVGYGDIVPKTSTGQRGRRLPHAHGRRDSGHHLGHARELLQVPRAEEEEAEEMAASAPAPASAADVVTELSAVRAQLASLESRLAQASGSGSADTS